jgi:plastocyanin
MGLVGVLALSIWALPNDSEVVDVMAAMGAHTVELRASEFRFDPERVTVKPGMIRFIVHNVGDLRHVLTVEWEGGIGGASIRIPPGQTKTLDVTLERPGSYVFHCPLEDDGEGGGLIVHREKGMEGRLIVAKE